MPISTRMITMTDKAKLEYIWLDGYKPTQSMRSKTMIRSGFGGTVEECPMWSFDGSSTLQADGGDSDCLLKPVAIYPDPDRINGYLVMCEVLNADGTPHESNGRATIDDDDDDFWFGFEQEYFLWDPETKLPLGFPRDQTPQGQFYCSVGGANAFGREIIEDHLNQCLEAGLNVEGINAEVAAGQWEYQIFAKGARDAGDQIWVSRYLAERNAEKYGLTIDWHLSHSAIPTGMVVECTPTFPTLQCASLVTNQCLPRFVKHSVRTSRSILMSMAQTTT